MDDSFLTEQDRKLIAAYKDPKALRRAIRLMLQYLVGAGVFTVLTLVHHEPRLVLVVYGIFVAFILVRIISARRRTQVMGSLLEKLQHRIEELEQISQSKAR